MNTLIAGFDKEVKKTLFNALQRRHHYIVITEPTDQGLNLLEEKNFSLILISDYSEEAIQFCKLIRAKEHGRKYTIFAVITQSDVEHLHRLIDADIDQYIIESLHSEQRLDVRLAFAEKMARNKEGQFLIEMKLRESEARARSILRTTVDAIIAIDDRGSVRTFNKAAEDLFQYSSSEVIGQNIKVLMPQPYRREHDGYIHNYHQTGDRKIIGIGREVTGKRKDGSTFPMYLAVSEVNVNGQRLYTGIIRDVSEQRRLEQEVLRVSEHERFRIGQDLHDGLGQMLTGITLITKNIASSLKDEDHPLAKDVVEITDLLKEADEYARGLSRNLIPVELDSSGLVAALQRLATNAERLFNIECKLKDTLNIHFDDPTSLTHLFRIVQEATSNAVKHGNASKVQIDMKHDETKLIVKIEDNGTGFSQDWDKHKGLGVRIMKFRSRLIGANFEIEKSSLGGAAILVTLLAVGSSYKILSS
ncbi:sensor histidine kinase [Rhodohalobacter sp. 614A]|uniref:sensor histidine kinase n=1 Tax=Rhodohalobacter sp. 614A TaxID=2908649 RepID=UPI001F26E88C|nr:PAS domain S-box protein [Rhodohalobacter sp. 614A]